MKKSTTLKQDERYFRTSNFYLGAFLFAKGLELVGIDKLTDAKRAQFVFADTIDRGDWVDAFNFGKTEDPLAAVDSRKFVVAIKTLKDKLYQD